MHSGARQRSCEWLLQRRICTRSLHGWQFAGRMQTCAVQTQLSSAMLASDALRCAPVSMHRPCSGRQKRGFRRCYVVANSSQRLLMHGFWNPFAGTLAMWRSGGAAMRLGCGSGAILADATRPTRRGLLLIVSLASVCSCCVGRRCCIPAAPFAASIGASFAAASLLISRSLRLLAG